MMTDTQRKIAEKVYAKDSTIGRPTLARLCGCSQSSARRFLDEKRAGDSPAPEAEPKPRGRARKTPTKLEGTGQGARQGASDTSDIVGVSVKEFASRFDFAAMLRKTIKELCGNRFVSDADIRARCGIPIPAFRSVADLPEFRECQIKDQGTVFWSSKENVDVIRQQARKWGVAR